MKSKRIYINAYGPANLFSMSSHLSEFVSETELVNGLVFIFSIGSTGAVVNVADEDDSFVNWVSPSIPYRRSHRHPGNAFAHLRSTFLGSTLTLAVADKVIKQGQGIRLLENTAGRKQRPIEMRAFGEFLGGGRINMKVASNTLPVKTNGWIDMIDLKLIATDIIVDSGIIDGFLQIESLEKDSAISTTEYEGALLSDTADFIADLVKDVDPKLRGGVASTIVGSSMNFPIKDGRLEVGVWQQPIFIDFGEAGDKEIFFQAVGM